MVDYQKSVSVNPVARKRNVLPAYSLHKPSGLARVTWLDKTVYLGEHSSPESFAKYQQVLALFAATGKIHKEDKVTTAESLVSQYLAYLRNSGEVKDSESRSIAFALKRVTALFGNLPASEFRAIELIAVRNKMIADNLKRLTIVKYQRYIVRCWRWGVRFEMATGATLESLRAVENLKKRRSAAAESVAIASVPWDQVVAISGHVPARIWAMILLQWHTGMRPGEVTIIRPCDVDRSGPVWIYRPEKHKTDYQETERLIGIGPQGQEVLLPWLDRPADSRCFSPIEAHAERSAAMRAARKTKVQPSQLNRSNPDPKRSPGDSYNPSSYRQAINKACKKAGIEPWNPNQLRHSFATRVRGKHGLDAAQVTLGHEHANVTQLYAEKNLKLIAKVAKKLG